MGTIVDSYQMSIVLEVLSNRMQGVDNHLISEAYYVLGNHDWLWTFIGIIVDYTCLQRLPALYIRI